MTGLALALCYSGWLAICLAMPKHCRQVLRREPAPSARTVLKGVGGISLATSLGVLVKSNGWSFGPVEWVAQLTVTSLFLVLLLPYAPRLTVGVGVAGIMVVAAFLLR